MSTDPARRGPAGDPPGLDDADARRALRRIVRFLQLGGVAFLLVVSLGLAPRILAGPFPALGRIASVAAWILAPALTLGLLLFAALRLRR